MIDCGCGASAKSVTLIDRRTYAWEALGADAQTLVTVVDAVDLRPFASVELWVRVHAASIAHSDGAFAAVELQGISRDWEDPDVIFDGGVMARLLLRAQSAGTLLQRRLPPGALATARLRIVMQQATSQESNAMTVSAGLVGAAAFRSEVA